MKMATDSSFDGFVDHVVHACVAKVFIGNRKFLLGLIMHRVMFVLETTAAYFGAACSFLMWACEVACGEKLRHKCLFRRRYRC